MQKLSSHRNACAILATLLVTLCAASARADTFTFDAQGLLIKVTYTGGGSGTFTYDDAGNRKQQVSANP